MQRRPSAQRAARSTSLVGLALIACFGLTLPTQAAEAQSIGTPARVSGAHLHWTNLQPVDFHVVQPDVRSSRAVSGRRMLVKFAAPSLVGRRLAVQARGLVAGHVRSLGGRWVSVRVKDKQDRKALRGDPSIARVDHDRVSYAQANDPAYDHYQSYLRQTMDFPQAWNRQSGAGVTVAVVDTGVDASHPDLGKVLKGHDFVDNDQSAYDPNGHGTFSAGIIAARRGNHRGIAGASRASILPVRVLNTRGYGRDSDVARGIRWATNNHADVINLSLGGVGASRVTRDAVRYAERHDVVVVASSGNGGSTRKTYPAAYPSVVAVGATDDRDQLAWFSERGDWVDVVAPGWNIASTLPGNRYGIGSGTSFSAPLVTGAVALLIDAHPRWEPEKIRATLLRSTADAGAIGPDPYTGFGVVDVDGALGGKISESAAARTGGKAGIPTTARTLDRRTDGALDPEGASPWLVYHSASIKEVTVEAKLSRSKQGVLRGDLRMEVYDANLHLIRRVDRSKGSGTEHTTIKTGATFYVRISNNEPTRGPGQYVVKTSAGPQRATATVGDGPRPVVVDASPQPNQTEVDRGGSLVVTLGRDLLPSSINPIRLQLIDGATGARVSRSFAYDAVSHVLTVDPTALLRPNRRYALILSDLRTDQGASLGETRIGFRTGA